MTNSSPKSSVRTWRLSLFTLLLIIGLLNCFWLLLLLSISAGTGWLGLITIAASVLLLAATGLILFAPRFGSITTLLFLGAIASSLIVLISEELHNNGSNLPYLAIDCGLIACGLWMTAREAFGITRHSSNEGLGFAYFLVSTVLGTIPFALVFGFASNFFHKGLRPGEVREIPRDFIGTAYVIWGEPGYPPLPKVRGMLVEHFPPRRNYHHFDHAELRLRQGGVILL